MGLRLRKKASLSTMKNAIARAARKSGSDLFGQSLACIIHHFIRPQVSPTAFKSLKIAELSGLRPEPRRGAQAAPQTPTS